MDDYVRLIIERLSRPDALTGPDGDLRHREGAAEVARRRAEEIDMQRLLQAGRASHPSIWRRGATAGARASRPPNRPSATRAASAASAASATNGIVDRDAAKRWAAAFRHASCGARRAHGRHDPADEGRRPAVRSGRCGHRLEGGTVVNTFGRDFDFGVESVCTDDGRYRRPVVVAPGWDLRHGARGARQGALRAADRRSERRSRQARTQVRLAAQSSPRRRPPHPHVVAVECPKCQRPNQRGRAGRALGFSPAESAWSGGLGMV